MLESPLMGKLGQNGAGRSSLVGISKDYHCLEVWYPTWAMSSSFGQSVTYVIVNYSKFSFVMKYLNTNHKETFVLEVS